MSMLNYLRLRLCVFCYSLHPYIILVDPEPVLEKLDLRREYTLYETSASHTFPHLEVILIWPEVGRTWEAGQARYPEVKIKPGIVDLSPCAFRLAFNRSKINQDVQPQRDNGLNLLFKNKRVRDSFHTDHFPARFMTRTKVLLHHPL